VCRLQVAFAFHRDAFKTLKLCRVAAVNAHVVGCLLRHLRVSRRCGAGAGAGAGAAACAAAQRAEAQAQRLPMGWRQHSSAELRWK